MQDDVFLLEHKDCKGQEIKLKKEWLTKVITEAMAANKVPVLAITFGDHTQAYVLTRHEFEAYREYRREQMSE